MHPMLARTWGPKFKHYPCFVQPKLNGVRCLYQGGEPPIFQSRDEKLISSTKFSLLVDELNFISSLVGQQILDGELYIHGWRLQRINGAVSVNSHETTEDSLSLQFHIFDIASPEKFSSRFFPFYNACPKDLKYVKIVPTAIIHSHEDMLNHFHMYTRSGYEGIMLRPDGPYEPAKTSSSPRSKYLWKHKQWQDGEFVCCGTTIGEGKASIGIGALTLLNDEKNQLPFKVGTGFTDEERIFYFENPPIGRLVKIRYLELTADGIPFNPSFLCVME